MTVPPHQPYDPSRPPGSTPPPSIQPGSTPSSGQPPGYTGYGQSQYSQPGYSGSGTSTGLAGLLGAIGGLAGTVIGLTVLLSGAGRTVTAQMGLAEPDAVGLLLLLLGAVLLAGVVLVGHWVPATPFVPGVVLTLLGLVGMVSNDFTGEMFRLLPATRANGMFISWIGIGAVLAVGALMTSAGVAAWLARQRRRPASG